MSIYTSTYPGDQVDTTTVLACLAFLFFAFVGVVSLARWITDLYKRTKRGPTPPLKPYSDQIPQWVHTAIGGTSGLPDEERAAIKHIQIRNNCFLPDAIWLRCIHVVIGREEAGSKYSEELREDAGLHPGMWEAATYQEVLRIACDIFDQEVEG